MATAAAAGMVAAVPAPQSEPVADMNHALHVIEREIECSECHQGVESQARAGVPSIAVCKDCHEEDTVEDMGGTDNARMIVGHMANDEELWWPDLYVLPDHVVFSHFRHVSLGEIPCEKCHGAIASSTTLPEEPVEEFLTMDGCMECHAEHGASDDCAGCHK